MKKEECYFLGIFTRTHGLAGNVILKLDTDQPQLYEKLEGVFVEINGLLVPFFVEKQQWSKDISKIIFLKNANLRIAEQLVGKSVFLPLTTLPALTGNQFYYHEVIGYQILDENKQTCGVITKVNDQTTQHYFFTDYQGKEILIPIIKDWIIKVDRAEKYIQMKLPEGLLDIWD